MSSDDDESERESDDENLADAYNQLFIESKKMTKFNKKLRKCMFESKNENKIVKTTTTTLDDEQEHILKNNKIIQEKLD